MQLNLVPAEEVVVVLGIAVEGNNFTLGDVGLEWCIQFNQVVAVKPLSELFAFCGDDLGPLHEQVGTCSKGNFYSLVTVGKLIALVIVCNGTLDGDGHQWAPANIFALVLQEFKECLSCRDRYIKANMFAGCLGGHLPALLISLLGEIPGLVKGTGDVVVDRFGT